MTSVVVLFIGVNRIMQFWLCYNNNVSTQDFARTTHKRNRIQLMAVHDELIKRMRTVVEADASTSLGDLSSVVSFLTGHQDPNIGRVEAVEGGIEQLNRSPLVFSPGVARQTSVPSPERALLHVVTKPILLFHVSKLGSSVGELRDPLGVACLLSGDICVAEWGNKRLQIFDSVGKSVCVIGEGRVEPQDVAVSLRGNIIATDASHKRLEVFSPSGKSIAKWGLGKFFHPCGVSMSPNGNCIVTDVAEHSVNIYQGEKKCLKVSCMMLCIDLGFAKIPNELLNNSVPRLICPITTEV